MNTFHISIAVKLTFFDEFKLLPKVFIRYIKTLNLLQCKFFGKG
ncbi:hypothetical protein VJY32_04100 [Ignavibacteria bacterium 4148-Me]